MTVVKFRAKARPGVRQWQPQELHEVAAACSRVVGQGQASGFELGITECGDPQIYVLGPPPAYDCILCISRVGHRCIIEDGQGRILFEHDGPMLLAEQALMALQRRKAIVLAQVAAGWHALREAFEEKTEALTAEPVEILAHIAPQLAALA